MVPLTFSVSVELYPGFKIHMVPLCQPEARGALYCQESFMVLVVTQQEDGGFVKGNACHTRRKVSEE